MIHSSLMIRRFAHTYAAHTYAKDNSLITNKVINENMNDKFSTVKKYMNICKKYFVTKK